MTQSPSSHAPSSHAPLAYGNVEEADFLLEVTEGEPWRMPLQWETEAGEAIDISEAGWGVAATVRLADGDRPVPCVKTDAAAGWFEVALSVSDVAALPVARPGRLVVTIADPAGQRFHFVFAVVRRPL